MRACAKQYVQSLGRLAEGLDVLFARVHCDNKTRQISLQWVLIKITAWHFSFHPVNGSFLHVKGEYGARSNGRFSCSSYCYITWCPLTHWGRVTHICVSKLTIIGSDNGLSPGRRQAIIWINARILLIRPLGTNFSEILIRIQTFSFKKMHLKMSSAKWRPFASTSMC